MPSFDVVSELAHLPVGRDIRWSASSLGTDEDAFAGIRVALQRLEGEGHVHILDEDRETYIGQRLIRRVTFQRLR